MIVGTNPAEGRDVCLLSIVCCQVEGSATDWTLPEETIECGVSERDKEAS